MMRTPEIAVVASGILTGLGLRSILEKIIPGAEVTVFDGIDDFSHTDRSRFYHFFVSASLYMSHAECFRGAEQRTILLRNGALSPQLEGFHSLDIRQSETELVRDLLRLHQNAHRHGHPAPLPPAPALPALTPREKEVLVLVTRGMTSRQIALRLRIAPTTVISHRRHITEKLGIRSAAGLTIYAVTRGLVDADALGEE